MGFAETGEADYPTARGQGHDEMTNQDTRINQDLQVYMEYYMTGAPHSPA